MLTFYNIIMLVGAYLVGSIPSAVWIGQWLYNTDVREYGSGNAGATNTFRVLGKKAGIPVLLMDISKGAIATLFPLFFTDFEVGSTQYINLQLVLGLAALIGHVFPVFVGFRGGKGIATLLGIVFCVHPVAALTSLILFLLILFISRYVSLSSIIASLGFPIYILAVENSQVLSLNIFSLFISLLVVITHQKNIERLIRKEESKIFSKPVESDAEDED